MPFTFEQIEERLREEPPFRLEGFNHNPEESVESFVYNFIVDYNRHFHTLFPDGSIQTFRDKHRSLRDIYMVCLNYYPSLSLRRLKEILIDLLIKEKIFSLCCSTIGKLTYFPPGDRGYGETFLEEKSLIESGCDPNRYCKEFEYGWGMIPEEFIYKFRK